MQEDKKAAGVKMDDRKSLTESELSQQRFVLCVFVLLGSQSEPIKPKTKRKKRRQQRVKGGEWRPSLRIYLDRAP